MSHAFLFEIGTEELPALQQRLLAEAMKASVLKTLNDLNPQGVKCWFTPRRLVLKIDELADKASDTLLEKHGPFLNNAFDADGQPTPAGQGFAKRIGLPITALDRVSTKQGERLCAKVNVPGSSARQLVIEAVNEVFKHLSGFQTMRWDDSGLAFIRPIRWICLMLDDVVLTETFIGLSADQHSLGHRFHHPGSVRISHPNDYVEQLRSAKVMVDPYERRTSIQSQISALARPAGAQVIVPDALLDEVVGLVEWPVVMMGQFDEVFLSLPTDVIATVINAHQKCFHVVDASGRALPLFVLTSNIESRDPEHVIHGNERVMAARLSDAQFFDTHDCQIPLETRVAELDAVIFQEKLGSLGDRVRRIEALAVEIGKQLSVHPEKAQLAARLCKADLTTQMVGEFPELAGVVGRDLLRREGEDQQVADAVCQHAWPRHAGDLLPETDLSKAVALADRIDLLAGFFAIKLLPTGEKDPFALRRAALGVVRILIEGQVELNLSQLIITALSAYANIDFDESKTQTAIETFIHERLKAYYRDRSVDVRMVKAVLRQAPTSLYALDQRVQSLTRLVATPAGATLAEATKRCGNILRKQGVVGQKTVHAEALIVPQERALFAALEAVSKIADPLLQRGAYTEFVDALVKLAEPIEHFFEHVRIVVDDPKLTDNRLALLSQLHALMVGMADLSELE